MKALEIKVERTGFPIILAGHEFFFDSSPEHLIEVQKNYETFEKEINSIEGPSENDVDNLDLEPYKELLGKGYDVMLGEGTFDKLYADIPDINAWLNAFFDLYSGIADQLDVFKNKQMKNSEQLKQKYLKKVSQKG
ncbi:TPA: hypothetical protein ACGBG5_003150 [Enterococcus faecalis]